MPIFDLRYAMGEFSSRVQKEVNIVPMVDVGFKNFFSEQVLKTNGFNFWVTRQGRPVAVDINPHEKGHITSLDKSTNKFFVPPTFDYSVVYSAFQEFETIMGATDGRIDGEIYKQLVKKTAKEVQANLDRLARREELQRAQALLTGIVTMKNGDNIDFKRDGDSLVAYNSSFGWDVNDNNPSAILIQLIEFLITKGMVDPTMGINIIVGTNALTAFKENETRQKEGDIKDQTYMKLATGQTVKGLTPQGSYSAGNYRVNLWGYTGYYDDPDSSVTTSYMDTNSIIALPNTVPFEMVYCGTKGWSDGNGDSKEAMPRIIKGKRNFYKLKNKEECSMKLGVRSAFTASLKEVDRVATAQVVGSGQQG